MNLDKKIEPFNWDNFQQIDQNNSVTRGSTALVYVDKRLLDLEHNAKFISFEIQELEEEIILLMKKLQTKKVILQHDKYQKQILIYKHQLSETKKQIEQWKI